MISPVAAVAAAPAQWTLAEDAGRGGRGNGEAKGKYKGNKGKNRARAEMAEARL